MPKNIILLSDGTGNSASKLLKTNVWRLYQALDLAGPDPANPTKPEQSAYYDDGVGTASFLPLALIGGAFGWGLKRNVLDLYTFLCRNYAPDDRVYCFGFSRGAFTIRVLVGLINSQGLVHAGSEAALRAAATAAFRAYRRKYKTRLNLERVGRALRDRVLGQAQYDRQADTQGLPIMFLGLWDTVAAYGLPIEELTRAWNQIFPLSVPDREPCANIQHACHALALDDERKSFHPVLWNESNLHQLPGHNLQATHIHDERITQVWFAGMHSSVGGGYADDALAHVSLDWMMGEAAHYGLWFKPDERAKLQAARDLYGNLYDSRRGLGGTYRYRPRKLAVLTKDIDDLQNRVVIARPKIHESVFARIAAGTDSYAPIVLPPRYAVVTASGDIVTLSAPPPPPQPPAFVEHQSQAENREHLQEKVWNLVWRKSLLYFLSVLVALALAGFPLYRQATLACEGWACFLSLPVRGLGLFLPGFASPWLDAYQSHPGTFSLLALALGVLVWIGSRLQMRIFDDMRALWLPILQHPGVTVPVVAPLPIDRLFRFRSHVLTQRFFKFIKWWVLPWVAGVTAAFFLLAGLNHGLFAMLSSIGRVCTPTPRAQLKPDFLEAGVFENTALCWASGVGVRAGERYRLTLTLNEGAPWMDKSIRSGIGGFAVRQLTEASVPVHSNAALLLLKGVMSAMSLFRRDLTASWFMPIARIGEYGSDEYPLRPVDRSIPDAQTRALVAEITARRDGELFLFVNDVVLPLPQAWQRFYNNNVGAATVTIERVTDR